MNKGYEKSYEKKRYEKSYERTNYRRIKYKDWCSIKLIPFMTRTVDAEKKEKDIFLLLGLDSKYKEWAPFGGTCHELYGSCKSQTKEQLLKCLSRELKEESRELLDLNSDATQEFNLEECKKIHAVYDLPEKYDTITVLHENFYFVNWSEFEDEKTFDKLKSEFHNDKRNKEIERKFQDDRMKLKSYFEMSDIDLVPLSKFHDMILNTIEDVYYTEKDEIIRKQFSLLFEKYISNGKLKVKSKLKSRLWGRFLYYLISGLKPNGKYSDINEFIKNFRSLLESKGCVK